MNENRNEVEATADWSDMLTSINGQVLYSLRFRVRDNTGATVWPLADAAEEFLTAQPETD